MILTRRAILAGQPPKAILKHCTWSLSVTSTVKVLLQTWMKPSAGTGAHKQRVGLSLHMLCRC